MAERGHGLALPQRAGVAAVTLAPPACRFIFRAGDDAVDVAGTTLGVTLPREACRAQRHGERAALWLGPDEWLLLAPRQQALDIATGLSERLAGIAHALVNVSDRNLGLLIEGPGSEDVLSSGCPLDLDAAVFPAGACMRTLFAKAEVVLWRNQVQTFHVEVARSFLPYVLAVLDLAVRDAAAMAQKQAP
jgi:sarcosine oxidase, subunit gamma